jgi:hypothetical protein
MPTAADHGPADKPPPEGIRHEPASGLDETTPLGAESRPGPLRAAMTARLKRIRHKLRQQRHRP